MFKIISRKKLNALKRELERATNQLNVATMKALRASADCEDLRQQFNEQLSANRRLKDDNAHLRQFKRDTIEALAAINLSAAHIEACKNKCADCDHEQPDCRKYAFGRRTFCIIPFKL